MFMESSRIPVAIVLMISSFFFLSRQMLGDIVMLSFLDAAVFLVFWSVAIWLINSIIMEPYPVAVDVVDGRGE